MRIRVAHASLQFSDTSQQHTADITAIFKRAVIRRYAWVMGTEAGPGANNTSKELVRIARQNGYKAWVPSEQGVGAGRTTDCWLAVRADLVKSGWKTGFIPAIPGSKHFYEEQGLDGDLQPKWGPKGLVTASFNSLPELGHINLGVAHYLTGGQSPTAPAVHGVNHWDENSKLARVIADWAKDVGKGTNLAFYSGDQNMRDDLNKQKQGDTFKGGPLTSLADELKQWQNTGHGPIDVIANYDGDTRVKGQRFTVLNDKQFFLNTDHYFLEGVYNVAPLKS